MMLTQDFPFISHSPKRWAEFLRTRTPIRESIVPLLRNGDRDWKAFGNEALFAHTKWMLGDGGIVGRRELANADSGLYQVLSRRKLLGSIGFEEKQRDWASMSREELVALAKEFIAQKGLGGRGELEKADAGLYKALGKRKLLDEVGLEDLRGERRGWASMSREELVACAREFVASDGITGRKGLQKADTRLYEALRKRKLLGTVFSDLESSQRAEAVDGVLDALDSFGDDE